VVLVEEAVVGVEAVVEVEAVVAMEVEGEVTNLLETGIP